MRALHICMVGAFAAILSLSMDSHAAEKSRKAKRKTTARARGNESASVESTPVRKILNASRKIDQFLEADYSKQKIAPNPKVSDETFVRRIYLDITGRIPTYEEARTFLDSKDPQKRSQLIDQLLDSDGYVSHQFNYWADLLRLQSRMRYAPAKPYLDFVKESLQSNKPYDQFVRELITAEGYTWDNGAAGYYIRDTGMPLDNMSNTIQVFLGTQLVCAQCHNHPYDSWTQKQYYKLAAFTYGVETRDRRNPRFMELRKMRTSADMDREVYRSANRILRPLAYRVHESNKKLRLPKDYAYNDAKPLSTIEAETIFGEKIKVEPGDSPKEIYAKWMTSPKNPRFAKVIANRLWKRAMGLGLIEPVDDLGDGASASNPRLMEYLTQLMVDLKFDTKQYLRALFNTQTYQREVTTKELSAEDTYYFPGPVLRRMSAEQLWDSMLAVTIPYVDERKGQPRNPGRYTDGEPLVKMEMREILKMAEAQAEQRKAAIKFREQTAELQKKFRIATRTGDRETANKLRAQMNEIRRKIYGERTTTNRRPRNNRNNNREKDPRWSGFSTQLVRASEVESPARPGHFLRQFGQSDRETIENANTEATVPQILTLLNGPMYSQLANRNSVLYKNLQNASGAKERLEVIYLSILGRRPTEREQKIALPSIEKGGLQGAGDVIWALLNTQEFMFVQ